MIVALQVLVGVLVLARSVAVAVVVLVVGLHCFSRLNGYLTQHPTPTQPDPPPSFSHIQKRAHVSTREQLEQQVKEMEADMDKLIKERDDSLEAHKTHLQSVRGQLDGSSGKIRELMVRTKAIKNELNPPFNVPSKSVGWKTIETVSLS